MTTILVTSDLNTTNVVVRDSTYYTSSGSIATTGSRIVVPPNSVVYVVGGNIVGTATSVTSVSSLATAATTIQTPLYITTSSTSALPISTTTSSWSYLTGNSYYVYSHQVPSEEELVQQRRRQLRWEREHQKKLFSARKALRRGVQLFENMFGQEPIRLFLNGQAIEIEGRLFNYRVSKKNNLLSHTANPSSYVIPYVLEILDKQNRLLCKGCTVFKDTPVVDQVIALILHIKHGGEERVLRNCNFFDRTELFCSSDILLLEKKK